MKVTDQDLHEQKLGITDNLPNIGDYVLATKYTDGDTKDEWALGFFQGAMPKYITEPRYNIVRDDGSPFRGNGFRRVKCIRKDVGKWLLSIGDNLENSPCHIQLWDMLPSDAFDLTLDKG
jgi:hypothetical protein